jgi:hypothetical protein
MIITVLVRARNGRGRTTIRLGDRLSPTPDGYFDKSRRTGRQPIAIALEPVPFGETERISVSLPDYDVAQVTHID